MLADGCDNAIGAPVPIAPFRRGPEVAHVAYGDGCAHGAGTDLFQHVHLVALHSLDGAQAGARASTRSVDDTATATCVAIANVHRDDAIRTLGGGMRRSLRLRGRGCHGGGGGLCAVPRCTASGRLPCFGVNRWGPALFTFLISTPF